MRNVFQDKVDLSISDVNLLNLIFQSDLVTDMKTQVSISSFMDKKLISLRRLPAEKLFYVLDAMVYSPKFKDTSYALRNPETQEVFRARIVENGKTEVLKNAGEVFDYMMNKNLN